MAKRILVIEDEAAIRDLICMNLEVAGYETGVFGDGIEVSEALKKEHKYDCALLDIMLPGKDGFALLPELSGYQIPVIFLTAKGDIQSKIKGLTEGAEDYLVKPFEMLEKLADLGKEDFVTHLMKNSLLTFEEAEAVFYFQMNGCLAINRMMLKNHCSDWTKIQHTIDQFIKGGLETFLIHDQREELL